MSQLLDALGYLGDSIDKPGRAIRGLLTGNANEGLAAIPFSDSLGITDPSNRISGSDLLQRLGMDPGEGTLGSLAGIGAEIATDPLTWMGAGLGRMLGKSATEAAIARGPRYGTTLADAENMIRNAPMDQIRPFAFNADDALQQLHGATKANPAILSELPPGSSFLGHGDEALAFKTPAGDVLRMGELPQRLPGRPDVQGMLPSTRTVDYYGDKAADIPGLVRAERTPLASNVGDVGYLGENIAPPGQFRTTRRSALVDELANQGVYFHDQHYGNIGVHNSRPVVIDPGAVSNLSEASWVNKGSNIPGYSTLPVTTQRDPGAMMNLLLNALGSDRVVRGALDAGTNPSLVGAMTGYGAAGGGLLGAASR